MPDRKVCWATFSNVPDAAKQQQAYSRKNKVPMLPELAGVPDYGAARRKPTAVGEKMPAKSLSVRIVAQSKRPRAPGLA